MKQASHVSRVGPGHIPYASVERCDNLEPGRTNISKTTTETSYSAQHLLHSPLIHTIPVLGNKASSNSLRLDPY